MNNKNNGGNPRLVLAATETSSGTVPDEISLTPDITTIGSDIGAHVRLEGADTRHAHIHHTEDDEYVFIQLSDRIESTVDGRRVGKVTLRSGSRIQIGVWTMIYQRDAHADHDYFFEHDKQRPPNDR